MTARTRIRAAAHAEFTARGQITGGAARPLFADVVAANAFDADLAQAAQAARIDDLMIAEGFGPFVPLVRTVGWCDVVGETVCVECQPAVWNATDQRPVRAGSAIARSVGCQWCGGRLAAL